MAAGARSSEKLGVGWGRDEGEAVRSPRFLTPLLTGAGIFASRRGSLD